MYVVNNIGKIFNNVAAFPMHDHLKKMRDSIIIIFSIFALEFTIRNH
jgi:hypothetical protein